MKYFRIISAIAGILALTTTFAFARDRREAEKDRFPRTRPAACDQEGSASDVASGLLPAAIDSETGVVYLVEARHEHDADGATSKSGV